MGLIGCEVCGGLVKDGERVVVVRIGRVRGGLSALVMGGDTNTSGGAYARIHLNCLHKEMPIGDGYGVLLRALARRLAGEVE